MLSIAAACTHDAVRALQIAGIADGQMRLTQSAAALLEIALDHQAAQDYGTSATGDEILRWMIGALTSPPP